MPPRSRTKASIPTDPDTSTPIRSTDTLDVSDNDTVAVTPAPAPQSWRTAPPGTPINVNSRLQGLEADILRAVSHQDDSVMDAVKRALNIAAQNDTALRAAKVREREDQDRIREMMGQLAVSNEAFSKMADAYIGLQKCHEAMVKHIASVTSFQERTAKAAEASINDTRSRLISAVDALDANTARQKEALEVLACMLEATARFPGDVAYLNSVLDALATILPEASPSPQPSENPTTPPR